MSLAIIAGLLGLFWSQTVVAQRWDNCTSTGKSSDIPGCSEVIEKNEYTCSVLAVAFANRGLAQVKKGHLEGALDDYNLSIKLNPHYAAAYLGRSEVLYRMGQTGPATMDEKKGASFLAQAQKAYNEGYQAYWDSRFELAIERYTEAIEKDPLFAYAYYGRADVHYYRENWSRAAEDYQVAVFLMSPKDVWYESGKRHLKFSRLYARQSGAEDIGQNREHGCTELQYLNRGAHGREGQTAQSPSETDPEIQTSPVPEAQTAPPSMYPSTDEPDTSPSEQGPSIATGPDIRNRPIVTAVLGS